MSGIIFAKIDGGTFFSTWYRIILPLSKPILATVALISFTGIRNDYLLPTLMLATRPDQITLIVAVTRLQSAGGRFLRNCGFPCFTLGDAVKSTYLQTQKNRGTVPEKKRISSTGKRPRKTDRRRRETSPKRNGFTAWNFRRS